MKRALLILVFATLLGAAYSSGAPKTPKAKKKSKSKTISVSNPADVQIGKPLPTWSEGYLDIHFINSGRGECCFYILPDGTTMVVDAGEMVTSKTSVPQRPNAETRPYITYANYIKHFLPKGKKAIDYCHLSHFHIDHIGCIEAATETAPAGYRRTGVLALYDEVPFNHILDRAYPDYTEDEKTPAVVSQMAEDWIKFVRWGVESKRFTAARFAAGENQIVMLNNPKRYDNFSIFNVCANGFVWGRTSAGEEKLLGKLATGNGNPASCGFHIRYGAFDYLACGDLTSGAQNRFAYYFRNFIGKDNLEAFKGHHHLAANSWGSKMQEVGFNPCVVLNHCFASNKPSIEKLMHVLPVVKGFYATNVHKDFLENPDVKANKLAERMTAYNGHIVLRVAPGGESYQVYMLDDGDFEYRVKSIHGPYKSK